MQQLTAYRGDTPSWTITVTRANVAVNLAGAQLKFAAKYTSADAANVVEHDTTEGGIVITDAANGIAQLNFGANDLAALPIDRKTALAFAIKLTEANGVVTTVADGTLLISPDVAQ